MVRPLCLASVFLLILFSDIKAQADDTSGSVLVETPEDFTLSYKQRRGTHGALFSLFSEVFDPVNYMSGYDSEPIGNFLGSEVIRLNGIELGYKYNVAIGSVAVLYGYSTGSASSAGHLLGFTKQSFSANAALDAIFDEPYVVPYGQVSFNMFDTREEKSGQEEFSESVSPVIGYRYGLLFQLDWVENQMDKDAKADHLAASGLENTYIDVFYANYQATEGEGNLESTSQMGLGLKLEF